MYKLALVYDHSSVEILTVNKATGHETFEQFHKVSKTKRGKHPAYTVPSPAIARMLTQEMSTDDKERLALIHDDLYEKMYTATKRKKVGGLRFIDPNDEAIHPSRRKDLHHNFITCRVTLFNTLIGNDYIWLYPELRGGN